MYSDDHDSMESYYRQCTAKPLSREEEADLARQAQSGDIEARNRFVEHYLKFVMKVALKLRRRGLDYEDLVMEGNFGLFHALDKFDPSKGYRFLTYAAPWVYQYIERAIFNHAKTVRVPVYQQQKNGRSRYQDLDLLQGISFDKAQEAGLEFEADGTNALEEVNLDKIRGVLLELLGEERPKKRLAILARFGLLSGDEMTLEEAGAVAGVTRERVRQMFNEFASEARPKLEAAGVSAELL